MYKVLLICFLLTFFKPADNWINYLYKNAEQKELILKNEKVFKIKKIENFLKKNNKKAIFDGKDIVFVITLSLINDKFLQNIISNKLSNKNKIILDILSINNKF